MAYAENTSVSVARSRAEIEEMLKRYGASGFVSGWEGKRVLLGFEIQERQVRLTVLMPDTSEPRFWETQTRNGYTRKKTEAQAAANHEAECRRMWRALSLVIKAKLEAVASGISTIEREFLADVVVPGTRGKTVGDLALPALASGGDLPKLLGAPKGGA